MRLLDQAKENFLNEEDKKRYQPNSGTVQYLGHGSSYGILISLSYPARASFNPSKAHMAAVKYLLHRCFAGFKLAAYSDASWGNKPENDKPASLYVVIFANGPICFKVGLQGLTVQSTIEEELVPAALSIKEAVCSAPTRWWN